MKTFKEWSKDKDIQYLDWDEVFEMAHDEGLIICNFNSPIDDSAEDISVKLAANIAREDRNLIYFEERD